MHWRYFAREYKNWNQSLAAKGLTLLASASVFDPAMHRLCPGTLQNLLSQRLGGNALESLVACHPNLILLPTADPRWWSRQEFWLHWTNLVTSGSLQMCFFWKKSNYGLRRALHQCSVSCLIMVRASRNCFMEKICRQHADNAARIVECDVLPWLMRFATDGTPGLAIDIGAGDSGSCPLLFYLTLHETFKCFTGMASQERSPVWTCLQWAAMTQWSGLWTSNSCSPRWACQESST